MATTRGQFGQLLAPGLTEVMFEWLKEHPEEYAAFMKVEPSDAAYDEDQVIAGLGLARLKPETEQITYDDPIQGGSKRYIHSTYGLAWQVTREMIDDDRYDIMTQVPGELMKSSRQLWEQQGANTLTLGFSTTTVADGLPLFSTQHPLLGGGYYSNRLSPDADISVTSIQDMLVIFENMVNERGLRMRLEPNDLWFNPNLQFVVAQTLQSQFLPGTGNNDVNPIQGRLRPHVLHFVTSINQWFVSNTDDTNFVKFKWRKKPIVETTDDFETKGVKHSIYFRFSTGATHWHGWAGSNP